MIYFQYLDICVGYVHIVQILLQISIGWKKSKKEKTKKKQTKTGSESGEKLSDIC